MKLTDLRDNDGATHSKKRLGRGHGSGLHKTAGKGQKGQKARTGHHGIPKPGFEGGQTAMSRRLPKRGFTNWRFKKDVSAVNLGDVGERFESGEVTIDRVDVSTPTIGLGGTVGISAMAANHTSSKVRAMVTLTHTDGVAGARLAATSQWP